MNKSNDFHNLSDPCKHNHVAVIVNMILIMIGISQDLCNGVQGRETTDGVDHMFAGRPQEEGMMQQSGNFFLKRFGATPPPRNPNSRIGIVVPTPCDGMDHTFAGRPQEEGMMQQSGNLPLITNQDYRIQ